VPTLVCVPITVHDADSALADAAAARDAGADLVEFRVDQFFTGSTGEDAVYERDAVVALASASPIPCIVTCRPAGDEGGVFDGDEAARISLFERLAIAAGDGEHPPRYLDVELATLTRSANVRQKILLAVDHPEQLRDLRTSLVLSTHDFTGRPADLFRRLTRMREEPAAAVLKVAYLARSLRDNLDLFDLLAEADRPTIALGMGRFGLMSRVLAPKFNAFLTFAALRASSTTAPGQPTLAELLDLYRFRSIRPSTRVYGVVGDPVEHSISPAVHNDQLERLGAWNGANAVYLPLPIPAGYEHFKATILSLLHHPRLAFSGCSVTIPHKENLVRLAREQGWEIDSLSDACGAANTLVAQHGPDGTPGAIRVFNTDAPAGVDCLRAALDEVRGARVLLLGAGGVARALAVGLLQAGARVLVANRTPDKAEALVRELASAVGSSGGAISTIAMERVGDEPFDACVNCTPLGMHAGPAPDQAAVDPASLARTSPRLVVMDTVYNPLETPLLAQARAAGLRTIDGLGMFLAQAARQFEAWTGHTPDRAAMESVARRALHAPAEKER
jgi:3-dehydroquinate dehydratase/shikimate dehydrogenase